MKRSGTSATEDYRQALFEAGILVPMGPEGLYGRSAAFERIVAGVERLVAGVGEHLGARVMRFPPVAASKDLLATDYLRSFPDLAGVISAFAGGHDDHTALLARLDAGRTWADLLASTDVVLCPAVCHPLYGTLPSEVEAAGSYYDVYGYVFRHEPSTDPARMLSFRQYELVYVGTAEGARAHRDHSLRTALELLSDLGISVTSSLANDPFFGRTGRLLAASQRSEALKYEVLASTGPSEELTAIGSANCHEDHFGLAYGLRTADGLPAHTACFGYGMERIALALLWTHGLVLPAWPAEIRHRLGLQV